MSERRNNNEPGMPEEENMSSKADVGSILADYRRKRGRWWVRGVA